MVEAKSSLTIMTRNKSSLLDGHLIQISILGCTGHDPRTSSLPGLRSKKRRSECFCGGVFLITTPWNKIYWISKTIRGFPCLFSLLDFYASLGDVQVTKYAHDGSVIIAHPKVNIIILIVSSPPSSKRVSLIKRL